MDGWSIGRFDDVDWSPWGSSGNARAKVLANGDGSLPSQGATMTRGDADVAFGGSVHEQFEAPDGATCLSTFKL